MAPFAVAAAVRISSTSWLITWVARRMSSAMGTGGKVLDAVGVMLKTLGERREVDTFRQR